MNEFLTQNENADGIIFTSIHAENDETKRQLGFYLRSEYIQPIYECLLKKELNLGLHERVLPANLSFIKYFDQNNLQASRKQILPFVENFIMGFIATNAS